MTKEPNKYNKSRATKRSEKVRKANNCKICIEFNPPKNPPRTSFRSLPPELCQTILPVHFYETIWLRLETALSEQLQKDRRKYLCSLENFELVRSWGAPLRKVHDELVVDVQYLEDQLMNKFGGTKVLIPDEFGGMCRTEWPLRL
jgi:hypothetical protein